jgi:biotin carboxylase
MKTFIVLQRIVLFRVDWRTLYDPNNYQLMLIVHEPTLKKLSEDEKSCFEEIYSVAEFAKAGIRNIIQTIANKTKNEIQLVTNDELCILLAAELRENFNLPGDRIEGITRFINKQETKALLQNTGLSLPKYHQFDSEYYRSHPEKYLINLQQSLGFPIFAKPTNSAASQYTSKLHNASALKQWCDAHQEQDNFELDEFISGTLFHCESIIRENKILFAQIGENAHPCFDFMSGKITGSITLTDEDPLVNELKAFNHNVLMALRPLPNCVTHVEFFRRPNGQLIFLEIACRAPGGMIVQMHQQRYGINFEQAHFAMQMGLEFNFSHSIGPHCAWAWFPLREGKVKALKPVSIKSAHEIVWKITPQEIYPKATSLIDYAGSIILSNHNHAQLRCDFAYLAQAESPIITDIP